jgi:hypothetical protein
VLSGRGRESLLAMAEGDAAFGQIVWREFQRDFVARQHANAVAAKSACEVREHYALVLQLNAEQAARKFLKHRPGYFNTVFLTHSTSLF